MNYREFLAAKARLATASGLDVDPAEVHPALKPHQRDAVVWAVRGGRRAVFAAFGLGKTLMQLEIVRLVPAKLSRGRGLIVLPLGVRQEFVRDARLLGLEVRFIRSAAEASAEGIYLTNYETVRDGKLDPRGFDVVSLDEAAILRGHAKWYVTSAAHNRPGWRRKDCSTPRGPRPAHRGPSAACCSHPGGDRTVLACARR